MKGIGFIFLLLGCYVLSASAGHLGDIVGCSAAGLHLQCALRPLRTEVPILIAQGLADRELESGAEKPVDVSPSSGSAAQTSSGSGEVVDSQGLMEPEKPLDILDETPGVSDETVERRIPPVVPAADRPDPGAVGSISPDWGETRRVIKIVNDYDLSADEVLTTLVVVAGNVRLQGTVTGNVLVVGGVVELSPAGEVKGTLHVIGGEVTGDVGAVSDLQVSNNWGMVPAVVKLVMRPHTFWGISKSWNFRLTFVKFGLLLVMYLLVVVLFPRPINAVGGLLMRRPLGSLLASLLMLALIPVILGLLVLSIVGVPVMVLLVSLLFALGICGKAAIFLSLGGTVFSGRLRPLAVIFGYTLYFMAVSLPYIDWVTFLIVNTLGIGLSVLGVLGLMRPEESRRRVSWSERV